MASALLRLFTVAKMSLSGKLKRVNCSLRLAVTLVKNPAHKNLSPLYIYVLLQYTSKRDHTQHGRRLAPKAPHPNSKRPNSKRQQHLNPPHNVIASNDKQLPGARVRANFLVNCRREEQ